MNYLPRHLWSCPFIPWPLSSRGSWCCGSRGSFTVASRPCSPAFPTLHLTCRFQSLRNPVICCVSQLCTGSSLLDHSSVTFSQGGICSSSPHGAYVPFFQGFSPRERPSPECPQHSLLFCYRSIALSMSILVANFTLRKYWVDIKILIEHVGYEGSGTTPMCAPTTQL